jgi:hypothetical protein
MLLMNLLMLQKVLNFLNLNFYRIFRNFLGITVSPVDVGDDVVAYVIGSCTVHNFHDGVKIRDNLVKQMDLNPDLCCPDFQYLS